ncbi:MAG TPA: hypothetical protein VF152_04860, partial [Acidimicrobiia bacterium]
DVPPPLPERIATERPATERPAPERPARERPAPERPAPERPAPDAPPRAEEPSGVDPFEGLPAMPEDEGEWGGSAAGEHAPRAAGASDDGDGREGLSAYVADEPIEAEVLDDDAFFASLREAVRDDDAPLVLGEDATSENFFDQDEQEEESGRRRFRRKR